MYQSLEPEPEGAICPKRSMPQALFSSPHDTLPVCLLAGIIHTRYCDTGWPLTPEIWYVAQGDGYQEDVDRAAEVAADFLEQGHSRLAGWRVGGI